MIDEMDGEGVRTLARRLVDRGAEQGKVDFKRDLLLGSAEQKVEFCKDLSAIANTDDEGLEDYGFIIIGAEQRTLRGHVSAWVAGKADNFSASLTAIAKVYLAPVPVFRFFAFEEPDLGNWGVIVIPPSSNQPHLIIKEVSGNPARHEWFVRVNDTTERAGVLDYSRIMQSGIHRAVRPLETALARLSMRLDSVEDERIAPADLLKALNKPAQPDNSLERERGDESLVSGIRRELSTPELRMEHLLVQEALQIRATMLEERPENPQTFKTNHGAELLKPIEYMEAGTQNFAQSIVTIARDDRALKFAQAVLDAVDVVAETPLLVGSHWDYAEELRLYPLVLSLYALGVVSAARNDGRLLRKVLDCELRLVRLDEQVPLVRAIGNCRRAQVIFNAALGRRDFEPLSLRLLSIIPSWCAPILNGKNAELAFYQAEFAFALEYMRVRTVFHDPGMPLSGAYLYANNAERAVATMLKRRSSFLTDLFGDEVEARLSGFDANVGRVVDQEAFERNFSQRKTHSMWNGAEQESRRAG